MEKPVSMGVPNPVWGNPGFRDMLEHRIGV